VAWADRPRELLFRPFSGEETIRSSANVRVLGFPQNSPIRSARSKSGSIRTWSPLKAAEIKAAESYADTSCLRGYFDLRRRDGDGGVLEDLDNSSAFDPHRRAWRTV
jgi:hypothetical protein